MDHIGIDVHKKGNQISNPEAGVDWQLDRASRFIEGNMNWP